ncbi:hypothetical protein CAOG_04857 [Capsaspora owczarzaki ATCC 30864]|uniref:Uncharacterized protein n=1 Tax=Capsaspora owczarzaki (strain ATCC 30864) TaxID=595528 RepID=A0A0D2WQX6_CAPO3|nr:hypothetical protein CAOG_04857 [Capsaspora owczarzaki ATCC 30864]KJE94175.1 hypothetical protein CAOG_004857 [Capsaspora owczarzaki ATCC 30864]|eukprot:XP_004347608.1 hypothetical protein CAOG_04857 [Capsaspora owczarzaki ATCC 30864]
MGVDTTKGRGLTEATAEAERLNRALAAADHAIVSLIQRAEAAKDRLSAPNRRQIRAARSELNTAVGRKSIDEVVDTVEKSLAGTTPSLQLAERERDQWLIHLQTENHELREAFDEFQCSLDLIMTKNRENLTTLRSTLKLEQEGVQRRLDRETQENEQLRNENVRLRLKLEEMRKIISLAIESEEQESMETQARIVELETENDGLRELLSVAVQSGSVPASAVAQPLES